MADELGERTEKPTPRRLHQARMRGQVPKSQDLASAGLLLGGTLLLILLGGWLVGHSGSVVRAMLDLALGEGSLEVGSIRLDLERAGVQMAVMLAPVLVVAFVLAWLTNFAQVGPLFTLKPIQPKLSKLNPVEGTKRLFGMRGQVKTLVNTVKLAVMVAVAWGVMAWRLPQIAALPMLGPAPALYLAARMAAELALILVVLLLVIAVADYAYQRWQHQKDLRMTKQQVKDERRSMEGDPQVKGRRLRMYQQIVLQQIAAAVPKADVVVNNPTHFSVALRYDRSSMRAPTVVAKGADFAALRIRHLAVQHGVPMVSRPPLARALYWGVDVGREIHPEHYEAVAEVLAYVYRIDQRAGAERRREAVGA